MAAIVRNYTIERGIQFLRQITLQTGGNAVDLTGATIEGKIRLSKLPTDFRSNPTGTGPVITTFDCSDPSPTTGVFTFGLSISKTLLLARGVYDYDVVVTFASGDKRRIIMGQLTAVEVVTRA